MTTAPATAPASEASAETSPEGWRGAGICTWLPQKRGQRKGWDGTGIWQAHMLAWPTIGGLELSCRGCLHPHHQRCYYHHSQQHVAEVGPHAALQGSASRDQTVAAAAVAVVAGARTAGAGPGPAGAGARTAGAGLGPAGAAARTAGAGAGPGPVGAVGDASAAPVADDHDVAQGPVPVPASAASVAPAASAAPVAHDVAQGPVPVPAAQCAEGKHPGTREGELDGGRPGPTRMWLVPTKCCMHICWDQEC
eukprot:1159128-Pelagomonas_calceolata.AAC.4